MRHLLKELARPLYRYAKSANEREFIRLLDRYGRVARFSPREIRFLSYKFSVPDCASFVWQFKDIFVDEAYRFETDSTNPVIYDCGANIGTSCLYFYTLFPKVRVRAYEADPEMAITLEENMAANGIKGVELVNKAVWVDTKGVEFGVQGADAGSILLDTHRSRVGSVRLEDELVKEGRVDLLKMDIEGAECEVLTDCRKGLANVERIFIEYHSWKGRAQRLDELLRVLTDNRFRYYIESPVQTPSPFLKRGDDKNMDLQLNIFAKKIR